VAVFTGSWRSHSLSESGRLGSQGVKPMGGNFLHLSLSFFCSLTRRATDHWENCGTPRCVTEFVIVIQERGNSCE